MASSGPEAPPHAIMVRVYYEDTDLAGVVYYANYLKFIERARTEWLRSSGVEQSILKVRSGAVFVVTRCDISYQKPALFDDLLRIETRVVAAGRASLTLRQSVWLASRPSASADEAAASAAVVGGGDSERAALALATVRLACLNTEGRPSRLPPEIVASVSVSASLAGRDV